MLTRRAAIKSLNTLGLGTLALGSGMGWRSTGYAQQSPVVTNQLKIPAQEPGVVSADVRTFNLNLQRGSSNFLPGQTTATFGINGSYLGPTLRFHRYETVRLRVANQLEETTTLHWHGFHLPPTEDGGPHQPIATGDTWNPSFEILQYAGTYWYHSHVLHKSGEQVYKGLAGMIIVEDEQQQLELPSEYGVDDVPLIVQDRRFNEDGSFDYLTRFEDNVMGMMGDTILVNGTHQAVFRARTRLLRLRLLNGANARSFDFAFADGREFQQIASDGGLLQDAVAMSNLQLAPAERAEILVTLNPGEQLQLVSLGKESNFPQYPGAMSRMMRSLNAQAFALLTIQCDSQLEDRFDSVTQLSSIFRLPPAAATNVRRFTLAMGAGTRSGDDRGPGTGARNGTGGGYGGGNFYINGRSMTMNFINERIKLNTTEIWEVNNTSPMMHPFHIHNGQFQLLDRNGNPPPANEMGWKDTVKIGSGETVRLIMRFTDYTDESNPYMFHCHILEHEDRGMMGQFILVE